MAPDDLDFPRASDSPDREIELVLSGSRRSYEWLINGQKGLDQPFEIRSGERVRVVTAASVTRSAHESRLRFYLVECGETAALEYNIAKMDNEHLNTSRFHWKWVIALAGFLIVAAAFLFSEHQAHFFGFLPYLLLLSCLFMHFFIHGGHSGKSH